MNFVRFAGELFIYYVLIALGGAVLLGFMSMIFQAIGIDIERFFEACLLPCGAVGPSSSRLGWSGPSKASSRKWRPT